MKEQVIICIRTFSGIFKGRDFNRVNFFKQSIESIFKNTQLSYKLLIVDDMSSNSEQIKFLEEIEKKENVEIVRKKQKTGRQQSFALLRYHGYISKAPYIIIADDDMIYRKGWLTELINAYEVLKKEWKGSPVGLLTGFNRADSKYPVIEVGGLKFGVENKWIGHNWLMSREVLEKAGWDELEPTYPFPKKWTSPWIDDGSYQMKATYKYGFENAFTYLKIPSLIDHIGSIGVHSPGIFHKGVK